MTKCSSFCYVILFLLVFQLPIGAEDQNSAVDFVMGRDLYLEMTRVKPLVRDDVLDKRIGSIVDGKGVVKSVIPEERYHCQVCVVLQDVESSRYGINLRYHLFFKSREEAQKAVAGMDMQFRGQLAGFTPLDSLRKAYIIDIIYESGTVGVE